MKILLAAFAMVLAIFAGKFLFMDSETPPMEKAAEVPEGPTNSQIAERLMELTQPDYARVAANYKKFKDSTDGEKRFFFNLTQTLAENVSELEFFERYNELLATYEAGAPNFIWDLVTTHFGKSKGLDGFCRPRIAMPGDPLYESCKAQLKKNGWQLMPQ